MTNQKFTLTNVKDIINALDGDDAVVTSLTNLTQNDLIDGGTGIDTFTLTGGSASDTITIDLSNSTNQLPSISGTVVSNFEKFDVLGFAGNINYIGGLGNDTYYIDSISDTISGESGTGGIDTVYASITYTLGNNLEHLYLFGSNTINGTGNGASNSITGNSSNNNLSGGAGNDSLNGGAGNDSLNGDSGNDSLRGGTGNDTLNGGDGDDNYFIDDNDIITGETSTGGIDSVYASVSYVLTNNLEKLYLTGSNAINGTGNTSDNLIMGNSANNRLIGGAGNDVLDGGVGSDSLDGGDGNDTYHIDSAGDSITGETITGGTDTVYAFVTHTLGNNVEHLFLRGTNAINGTGNSLVNTIVGNSANNRLTGGAGNDSLSGEAGNDILDGGTGSDTLRGGDGGDTYYVDATDDAILGETVTGGTDTVYASATYTLTTNVEHLFLAGSNAINGIGNASVNTITGNNANNILSGDAGNDSLNGGAGNDSLNGGAGNDSLTGGTGDDRFIYDTNVTFTASAVGVDTIFDFSLGSDKIVLDKTTFTSLTSLVGMGFSVPNEFQVVTSDASAGSSLAKIAYSSSTGRLFYNQNGATAGLGTGAHFATLSGNPLLSASDFLIQS